MKCIKCGTKNISSANYCKKCSYKFSDIDKKKSKRFTIVWFLEIIDKIDEIVSLSFIKDSKIVRALIILIIFFIGIFSYRNSNTFRILDTKYYDVEYNKKNKEYYVISNKDNIKLNIYSPKNIIKVNMSHYDKNDEKIDSESISSDGSLKITSSDGDYYIVEGVKKDKSKEIIKIYFYIESK